MRGVQNMNECVFCGKKIKENAEFYFNWNGKRVIIKPGYKFSFMCPSCCSKRIKKIDKRKNFLKEFVEITNAKISINMRKFWIACKHPHVQRHGAKDDYGWDIEEFLCAIGILTDGNEGYRLFLNEGCSILQLQSDRKNYSFRNKKDAIEYVKWRHECTGAKNIYGICQVSDFVSNEEISAMEIKI